MRELERGDEVGLGDLVGRALVHHDVLLVADVDEVEIGPGLLLMGRVGDELTFHAGDTESAQRAGPRDVGHGERGAGSEDREDIGVVRAVRGHQDRLDLDLAVVALREQRADGPVGQTAGQDLLLGGAAFALEISTGITARGGGALAVVDGQREELLTGLGLGGGAGGGEDDGLAELDGHGTVGLLGVAAGLDDEILAADGDDDFLGHIRTLPVGPEELQSAAARCPSVRTWR